MEGVDLSGTNAVLALIGNIDLKETNLIGVDLSASDLTSAQLTGAIFDNTTIWPNGFDPIAAGAINNDPNSGTDNHTDSSDSNDTVFIVSGGDFNAPFYNFTYESNGSVVDFSSHALIKGSTYVFKAENISSSHPFNIGEAFQVTSPQATGGPLDQNSATNNQSITVSIPSDYPGTLAYYCTIHSSMVGEFIITEPESLNNEGNQSDFVSIYQLDASHITELSPSPNPIAGTFSIVEELNASNQPEVRIRPMVDVSGEWEIAGPSYFYTTNPAYSTISSIKLYLFSQGIVAINGAELEFLDEDDKVLQITSSVPFNYTIPYTGTGFISVNGLPPGLSINVMTGVISGSTDLAGNYSVSLSLTGQDPSGNSVTASKSYILEVSEQNDQNGTGGEDHNASEGLPVFSLSTTIRSLT